MYPQYFRSLLYLNANITCSFTKKLQLLGDEFWGTLSPRLPTGAPPLDPTGGQTPSLLLCPPNNPVRSTPLIVVKCFFQFVHLQPFFAQRK